MRQTLTKCLNYTEAVDKAFRNVHVDGKLHLPRTRSCLTQNKNHIAVQSHKGHFCYSLSETDGALIKCLTIG